MNEKREATAKPNSLSLKVGRWAEASATGWGVLALVIVALAVVGATIFSGPVLLSR